MWPFRKKLETRAASYSDAYIQTIIERAAGLRTAKPSAVAGIEAAAGFVGRAFSVATLEGRDITRAAVSPALLSMIGRALIRAGEFVAFVKVMDGRLMLLPAASWDVRGEPEGWSYQVTLGAPDGTRTYEAPMSSVLHVRLNVDPSEPWRGRAPLEMAALAGTLSAELANALADEASGPRGHIMQIPADGGGQNLADIRTQLGALAGKVAMLQGGDWDSGPTGGSARYRPERMGANPSAALVELHKCAFNEVVAACGLSSDLFIGGEGTGQRESYRRALHGTIAPMARLLQHEIIRVIEDDTFSLSFEELGAADIAGRARAFQSLVSSGMATDKAAAVTGLMADDG